MENRKLSILIIEGSQSPPVFINNLINGLLSNGVEVALQGKSRKVNFVPKHKKGFTRLVSDYSSFRIRVLFDFLLIILNHPASFKGAVKITVGGGWGFQRILDIMVYAKIYSFNPDIVHIQWAAHIKKYSRLLITKQFKTIVSLRGRHINVSPRVDQSIRDSYLSLFPQVDAFHAVSEAIAREAGRYGAQDNRITVIYSMLQERFLAHYDQDRNPDRAPFTILSIGRFHWKKGYVNGIEAVYKLKLEGIQSRYTIVAGADIPEEILFTVNQLGLGDQVKFIDRIPHEQLPEFMKQHSVLLLPSMEEGIANVALEAMAVGLPVISTDAGGMGEVIVNDSTGWLVPVANPEALANAIIAYLQTSDESLTRTRKNAHNWILENHNENDQVRKFIQLYHQVLNK